MSHELSYVSGKDFVILRVHGRVTIERIQELAPQVAKMLEKTNCRLLLNDMSNASIDISFQNLYNSPKIMDASGVMRTIKRALVVPSSFEESAFLENATQNTGHNLKVFKNIEEAEEWLLDKK